MKIHPLANLGCKNNSENFPKSAETFPGLLTKTDI
jgi:hypothetical protein